MKTTTNNELSTLKPFIIALAIATLIAALFIGVTQQVDTGIDVALITQPIYKIYFG
jgi:hypothetical protein